MKKLETVVACLLHRLACERAYTDEGVLHRQIAYVTVKAEYEDLKSTLGKTLGENAPLLERFDECMFGISMIKQEMAYKRGFVDSLKLRDLIPSTEWNIPICDDDFGESGGEEDAPL